MPAKRSSPSETAQTTDAEIRHLCTYITDNGTIAAYFGINRSRVERVRGGMRQSYDRTFRRSRNTGHHRAGQETAGSTVHLERALIAASSRAHYEAIVVMLQNEALRNGESYDDALVRHVHGIDPAKVRALYARPA